MLSRRHTTVDHRYVEAARLTVNNYKEVDKKDNWSWALLRCVRFNDSRDFRMMLTQVLS